MLSLLRFLRNFFIRTPLEMLVGLLQALFVFLLSPIVILLRLGENFFELLKRKNLYSSRKRKRTSCGRLPEAVMRRPDPCIYSQRLLQSQGLPVTWNNPDIWIARVDTPENIEPDSYHLLEDTDYIVSVRVHNASADLALGVRVRLQRQVWGFNSPKLLPVETDIDGNEVFKFVNVMPMSSTITTFRWHTAKVESDKKYYDSCLQASLYHPMDIEPNNNLGQENTRVYGSNPKRIMPGTELTLEIPLFNNLRQPQRFKFEATVYEINGEDKFELQLKTTRGYAKWSPSQRLANFPPTLHTKPANLTHQEGFSWEKFNFQVQPRLKQVKNKYVGFEAIREVILKRDYSLPKGMKIAVEGHHLNEEIEIMPKTIQLIKFAVKVPEDIQPATKLPLNIIARSTAGVLIGGVTIILNIEE